MQVIVAHAIPGRVRLRLPDLVGRPRALERLAQLLGQLPGARSAQASPTGASLLIRFDPAQMTVREILAAAAPAPAAAPVPAHAHTRGPVLAPAPAVDRAGLTAAEVRRRQASAGLNILPEPGRSPFLRRFLHQFTDIGTLILLAGTGFSALTGKLVEAAVIGAITAMNAVIGAWRDDSTDDALQSLRRLAPERTTVLRDGQPLTIAAAELVPGDLVLLRAGDRAPADLTLLEVHDMAVDDAHLLAAHARGPRPVSSEAYLATGAEVLRGWGLAVVTATGVRTRLGRIAASLERIKPLPSPLERRMARLTWDLLKVAGIAAAVVVGAGFLQGLPLLQLAENALNMAAAAVPEGLPVFVTLALAAGSRRLARRGAYVRQMAVAESVGTVDVICADKTATLTRGEMTVRQIYAGGSWWNVDGDRFIRHDEVVDPLADSDMKAFLEVAVRCHNCTVVEGADGEISVQGSRTEAALVTLAHRAGMDRAAGHERRLAETSFTPQRRRMALTVRLNGQHHTSTKGAPETILPLCSRIRVGGEIRPMTDEYRRAAEKAVERITGAGHRVMALAYTTGEPAGESDFIFAGLAAMADPPRKELLPVIKRLGQSGIRTVLLTGDHPATAAAVGRELGLLPQFRDLLTGEQIDRLDDVELARAVERVGVFARVTPEHKARVIRAFQRRTRVVAYIGDGIDDAPPMRAADVGVAPLDRATDATREAAGLILADDRFEALATAIEQGRQSAGNIDEIARFLLSANIAEILVLTAAAVFGMPLPLLSAQLLWLNLIGDAPAALALGERNVPEDGRMPRRQAPLQTLERGIVADGLVAGAAAFGLYASALMGGVQVAAARTMALSALGASQVLALFRCQTRLGTPCGFRLPTSAGVGLAALTSGILLLATVHFTPLAAALGTVPLTMTQWLGVLGAALAGTLSTEVGLSLTRIEAPQPM